jgi:hypothetical protein
MNTDVSIFIWLLYPRIKHKIQVGSIIKIDELSGFLKFYTVIVTVQPSAEHNDLGTG